MKYNNAQHALLINDLQNKYHPICMINIAAHSITDLMRPSTDCHAVEECEKVLGRPN